MSGSSCLSPEFSDSCSEASQELLPSPFLAVLGVKVAGTPESPPQSPAIATELQR